MAAVEDFGCVPLVDALGKQRARHPDEFLREQLSPYKMPAEVRIVAHLPAAPSGKILKARLRELLASAG